MSSQIPMISLVRKGSKDFPRFVLAKADEYRNPVYWNGLTWSDNEADAILFNNVNEALWVYHDILMDSVGDRPCFRYVAPLYIEVYGNKPKLADLRAWLQKAVRIVVNAPQHGLGPANTVGVLILDTDETNAV